MKDNGSYLDITMITTFAQIHPSKELREKWELFDPDSPNAAIAGIFWPCLV